MGKRESKNSVIPFISTLPALASLHKRISRLLGITKNASAQLLLIEILFGLTFKGCFLHQRTQPNPTQERGEWNYAELTQNKRKLRRIPQYIIGEMLLSPSPTYKRIAHEYIVETDSMAREFFEDTSSQIYCDNPYHGGYTKCYYLYNPYLRYIYIYEDTLYEYAENLSGETEKIVINYMTPLELKLLNAPEKYPPRRKKDKNKGEGEYAGKSCPHKKLLSKQGEQK